MLAEMLGLGLGAGLGLMMVLSGLSRPYVPLATAIAALNPDSQVRPAPRGVGQVVSAAGLESRVSARTATDLALTDSDATRLWSERIVYGTGGVLLGLAVAVTIASTGSVAAVAGLVVAALFAFGGCVIPTLVLRRRARHAREAFGHAFGAFLDVVSMYLAGGASVEQAMAEASRAGDGGAFVQLREAIESAPLLGEPPWVPLGRLGGRLGIAELGELAATISLAGTEGAAVRASILAKTEALRNRDMAAAEAAAVSASERMGIPVGVIVTGFLILLVYPPFTHLLSL